MFYRWAVRQGYPVAQLRGELDRALSEAFGDLVGSREPLRWSPSLDVSESDEEITVSVEVPGVDAKELDITVSGNVLTISGEKRKETEERQGGVCRAERSYGAFRRSVTLPDSLDSEKVSAEYENGVLTVHLPKTAKAVAKRIPVTLSKN